MMSPRRYYQGQRARIISHCIIKRRLLLSLTIILVTICDVSLAFQPTVHCVVGSVSVISLQLKLEESNDNTRQPFFARALQKFQRRIIDEDEVDELDILEENVDHKRNESEVNALKALAAKTRLEAEKMELSLTLAKIAKLEGMIHENEDDRTSILRDIQVLMTKMNALEGRMSLVSLTESSESKSLGISDDAAQITTKNIVQEIIDGDKPLLSDDMRKDAISSFDKLPMQVKDMMARTVGLKGDNSTAVVDKLMAEGRLYEGDADGQFTMAAKANEFENLDVFINTDFAEFNSFVQSLLPESTRKQPLKEEYIDVLFSEVLGKDNFNPTERKPQAVPGGYLIRGQSKIKSIKGEDDGDLLIEALDRKIAESTVARKVQAFYILDPTPPSGEEILNDEDESPVLLITNYDVSPDTKAWVNPTISFLGLASIAIFTLGSFASNEEIIGRINDANSDDIDWLYNLSLPLAFSLLATQICHELGHLIVAIKDDIDIGMPTLVPGFQFGMTGAITPIKSPPLNIKSLFDFAIAGPLFGITASMALLYTGIEMTAFMDTSGLAQLPSIPVEILRSSALGGGIIEYLLGNGVLNSPDPLQMIKLHPFGIAGFSGLMINALSLLPIGNTDGGRICVTFFGRSFSRVVHGTALFALVLAGFFGADQANIFLCYAIFCQIWQSGIEIPCRNEVDELDSVRGIIAIAASLLVMLTLCPLPG